jgi:hypothetical protein
MIPDDAVPLSPLAAPAEGKTLLEELWEAHDAAVERLDAAVERLIDWHLAAEEMATEALGEAYWNEARSFDEE